MNYISRKKSKKHEGNIFLPHHASEISKQRWSHWPFVVESVAQHRQTKHEHEHIARHENLRPGKDVCRPGVKKKKIMGLAI